MSGRNLIALPVYNEVTHVTEVLKEALRHGEDVVAVDDGSTDGTSELLAARDDVLRIRHRRNQGYGAALRSAFDFAVVRRYEVLVTIDCDGQHQPQQIPQFVEACQSADIVSGSRYLGSFSGISKPPEDRRRPRSRGRGVG